MPVSEEERKEARCEYQKRYYRKHLEEMRKKDRIRCKIYRETHKEQRKITGIKYRSSHRQQIVAYYNKNRERKKIQDRAYRRKIVAQYTPKIKAFFSSLVCIFCGGKDNRAILGIGFHEIHGQNHEHQLTKKFRYISEHPEDFVTVCDKHHRKSHLLMKNGLSWVEIREKLSANPNLCCKAFSTL